MAMFIIRRILIGLGVLLVSTFIMFGMTQAAMDPFADIRGSSDPNIHLEFERRIELLNLEAHWTERYWDWLAAFLTGDMGTSWRTDTAVSTLIWRASLSTLELITAATFLSIFLGVAVGIISALRQYTTFDYGITFASFVLYSLPTFWVAVLLKQWGAIGYNDFLANPNVGFGAMAIWAAVAAIVVFFAWGGSMVGRIRNGLIAAASVLALLFYLDATTWWTEPNVSGPILWVLVLGSGLAIALLITGIRNKRALGTVGSVTVLVALLYTPINNFLREPDVSTAMHHGWAILFIIAGAVVGSLVGFAWRGPDWRQSVNIGLLLGGISAVLLILDRALQAWPSYMGASAVSGRPIATTGGSTPNLPTDNYWIYLLDTYTHLILPTVALMLISFAAYTRYSRASMLEVLNQDYIRTARAKGLTERTVIMRHGFRNSLIPLGTIVPIDVITLIGGAVITEQIFGRPGMGDLFLSSMDEADANPLMAYLVITSALAVLANLVADLIYAVLDPRIRVNA